MPSLLFIPPSFSLFIQRKHPNFSWPHFHASEDVGEVLVCLGTKNPDSYKGPTKLHSFSESGFLCVESERRSERVMTVRVGRFSRNPEEACNTQLFFDHAAVQRVTLISEFYTWSEFASLIVNQNYPYSKSDVSMSEDSQWTPPSFSRRRPAFQQPVSSRGQVLPPR